MALFGQTMQNKKICLLSDKNIYMKRICNFLEENNFDVHLISRHTAGLPDSEFNTKIKMYELSSRHFYIKLREIRRILKEVKPDIVHVHFLAKDALIPGLFPGRPYKFYLTVWGSDLYSHTQKRFNRWMQNAALLLCDKIRVLSPEFIPDIKKTFRGIQKKKIVPFSWGIDVGAFQNPSAYEAAKLKKELIIGETDLILLSYRNHAAVYNHHITIAAMPAVLKEFPQAKFIFTRGRCDNAYVKASRALADKLGVGPNFLFIDRWLRDEELRALVNMAEVSINIPSHDGLPATLLEIMASHTIPVVSDIKNYHPFFREGQNGFYLKGRPGAENLSRLLIRVLKTHDKIKPLITQNNAKYVQEHQDWKKQSRLLLDFYQTH